MLLLALAPSGAGAKEKSRSGPGQDTLLEDEFSPLDIFDKISQLRPRFRLAQDFVIDQDYDGAEVDSFRTAFRASVVAPLSKRLAIRLVGSAAINTFDFRGDSGFLDSGRIPDDPFDELFENRFRIEGRYRMFGGSTALVGGAQFSSHWESGSSYQRGIQGSGVLGVGHIFSDRFSVLAGVRVGSRLAGNGVSWSPVVELGWRVTEDLEIATQGAGLKLAYRVRKGLTLFAEAEWKSDSFRLEDRGGAIGRGVLRNRHVPVYAGFSWRIAERWRLRGRAGALAYQRYTILDDDRDRVDRATMDGAAFAGRADIEFRF